MTKSQQAKRDFYKATVIAAILLCVCILAGWTIDALAADDPAAGDTPPLTGAQILNNTTWEFIGAGEVHTLKFYGCVFSPCSLDCGEAVILDDRLYGGSGCLWDVKDNVVTIGEFIGLIDHYRNIITGQDAQGNALTLLKKQ